MKKIFSYFGFVLSIALIGVFTACNPKEIDEQAEAGLGIKTFFPTKVVTGQPMTISGTGLADVKEVVFPEGVSVTSIEHVGNGMIRVTAPSGIASAGGKLIVRTADDQAESTQDLTLGHTVISGFSKQDGEEIGGGEQLTIFGTDLEFISGCELLDPDGNPLILNDEDFYRKGTSSVIITIPKKIFDGTWKGKLYTFDGRVFDLPELTYASATDGGHWETVETVIWENPDPDGNGPANWNGKYRFALEGTDGNSEAITEIPADVWEKMKTTPFYMRYSAGDSYQIRVVTGWWNNNWPGPGENDIAPWNLADMIIPNDDGTFYIEVNLEGAAILESMDVEHLLFTGSGYTPLKLYFKEDIWVDGGGHMEIVKTPVWVNEDPEGNGVVNWNGKYRFALEGTDGNSEAITEIPADVWEKMKTTPFYMRYSAGDSYQIRVVTGWWNNNWPGPGENDIAPWNLADMIIPLDDGTFCIEVNLEGAAILESMDVEHLLFTGSGYTPLEIYFQEEVWVDGGDSGPKEVDIWVNDNPEGNGAVNWNGKYRFALEGTDGNSEAIVEIPADVWAKMKTTPFYMQYSAGESYQIRVVTGWWNNNWPGPGENDIAPWNLADMIIPNDDGTFYIEVNLDGAAILDSMDVEHLLFTGSGYTPLKLYFME